MRFLRAPPRWFWVFCALSLLWSGLGLVNFAISPVFWPDRLAELGAARRLFYARLPTGVMAAFGTSVLAGLAGALALYLRKRLAVSFFLISLFAGCGYYGWLYFWNGGGALFGRAGALFAGAAIAIGLVQVWLSARAAGRRWII